MPITLILTGSNPNIRVKYKDEEVDFAEFGNKCDK